VDVRCPAAHDLFLRLPAVQQFFHMKPFSVYKLGMEFNKKYTAVGMTLAENYNIT
jgi:hypothetical protein